MARTTKADLEKQLAEKEEELNKYRQWLMESDEKYNKLVEEKEEQFKLLPEYLQMKNYIERLELIQKNNEDTIAYKKEKEERLRDKIQELFAENKQLRSAKNQTVINDSVHNPRNAGRKPKSEDITQQQIKQIEFYLSEKKTGKEISSLMGISERTFYRLKKLAKYGSGN